jgi:hypothetical protein
LAGLEAMIDSPDARQFLWVRLRHGYLTKGEAEFRIPRRMTLERREPNEMIRAVVIVPPMEEHFYDAVFCSDALSVSEGESVRCFDRHTGKERWQQPTTGRVLRLSYSEGYFYGVEYETDGIRSLVRFAEGDGKFDKVCRLSGWENEFCPDGLLITSNGEVIRVANGEVIRRLEFPQKDYSDSR